MNNFINNKYLIIHVQEYNPNYLIILFLMLFFKILFNYLKYKIQYKISYKVNGVENIKNRFCFVN